MMETSALVQSPPDNNLVLGSSNNKDTELPRLREARIIAKAGQDDVKFLRQRVQRLKMEEERLWKQLDIARQKKEQHEQIKARRQEEIDRRALLRRQQLETEAAERARLHEAKDKQRHSIFLARSRLAMQRREISNEVRNTSRSLSAERSSLANTTAEVLSHQHQLVMDMKHRAAAARLHHKEQLLTHSQQNVESEVQLLEDKHRDDVHMAADLLTEEAQIIHRLNRIKQETQSVLGSSHGSHTPRLLSSRSGVGDSSSVRRDHV